jgi:hypothetical protein
VFVVDRYRQSNSWSEKQSIDSKSRVCYFIEMPGSLDAGLGLGLES